MPSQARFLPPYPALALVVIGAAFFASSAALHAYGAQASSNVDPSCPPISVYVNYVAPYQGLNGSWNRMTDILRAMLDDMGHSVLFIFERINKRADRAGLRFDHSRLSQKPLAWKSGQSFDSIREATATVVAEFLAENDVDPAIHPNCPVAVIQMVWAYTPEFTMAMEHIDMAVAEVMSPMKPSIFSLYDDDCIARSQAENEQKEGGSALDDNACRAGTKFPTIEGVLCISRPVCMSLRKNIPDMVGRTGVLPFSLHIDLSTTPRHVPFDDADIAFLYMGNSNSANMASLAFLCRHLLPRLDEGEQLHVFGFIAKERNARAAGCPASSYESKEKKGLQSLVLHDWTTDEELMSAVSRARAFVAPVLVPTGVSTKTVQALSAGTPVVTTPQGAEGIADQLAQCRQSPLTVAPEEDFIQVALNLARSKAVWEEAHQVAVPCVRLAFSRQRIVEALLRALNDNQR